MSAVRGSDGGVEEQQGRGQPARSGRHPACGWELEDERGRRSSRTSGRTLKSMSEKTFKAIPGERDEAGDNRTIMPMLSEG